jgi:hypothetical protein
MRSMDNDYDVCQQRTFAGELSKLMREFKITAVNYSEGYLHFSELVDVKDDYDIGGLELTDFVGTGVLNTNSFVIQNGVIIFNNKKYPFQVHADLKVDININLDILDDIEEVLLDCTDNDFRTNGKELIKSNMIGITKYDLVVNIDYYMNGGKMDNIDDVINNFIEKNSKKKKKEEKIKYPDDGKIF